MLSIFKYLNPLKVVDTILDKFFPNQNDLELQKTKRAESGAAVAKLQIKSKHWLDKWVGVLGYVLGFLVIIENIVFKLLNVFFGLHIPTDGEAIGLIAGVITLTYGAGQYNFRKPKSKAR